MTSLSRGFLVLSLASSAVLTACEPRMKHGAAVRRTLDAQATAAEPPADLRAQASRARTSLAAWQTDLALRLDAAVSESESEIARAYAIAGSGDLHCNQAMQLFGSAVEMVTRSTGPMDRDGVAMVEELLGKSAEIAREAGARATATSPQNSLKGLRRHQSDGSAYSGGSSESGGSKDE